MTGDPSDFLVYLDARHERIRSFLSKYPELLPVIDCGIVLAHSLSSITTVCASISDAKLWCGIMWQTISRYQVQSIQMILAGEMDAGMALLRMAAELARDVSVLGRDEALLTVWSNREAAPEPYRKKFKFDQTPAGRSAYDLYKFASRYGVHQWRPVKCRIESIGYLA